MLIKLTQNPISSEEATRIIRHPSCGALVTFAGNIRDENEGKRVFALEYEVYEFFFHAEVGRIVEELRKKWSFHEFALIQRVGKLEVGELGILIAISSPHRREALEALSYAIEQFKKRAPVWKKEYYQEGSHWVACHGLNEGRAGPSE